MGSGGAAADDARDGETTETPTVSASEAEGAALESPVHDGHTADGNDTGSLGGAVEVTVENGVRTVTIRHAAGLTRARVPSQFRLSWNDGSRLGESQSAMNPPQERGADP